MGDRSRLPKWAQEELAHLERNVENLKAQLTVGPDGSDTFVWRGFEGDTPLGEGTRIRFLFPDDSSRGPRWREHVDVRMTKDGELEVMGGRCISVRPSAGNVVFVKALDY